MTDTQDSKRSVIAARLREARPTISEIEAGNRRVSAEELSKFADIYDVTVSWLLAETAEQLETNDPRLQLAARELSKLKPDELDRLMRLLASMRSADTETGGSDK
jgi:transcriptional regulator with XRE-family HTH domain